MDALLDVPGAWAKDGNIASTATQGLSNLKCDLAWQVHYLDDIHYIIGGVAPNMRPCSLHQHFFQGDKEGAQSTLPPTAPAGFLSGGKVLCSAVIFSWTFFVPFSPRHLSGSAPPGVGGWAKRGKNTSWVA